MRIYKCDLCKKNIDETELWSVIVYKKGALRNKGEKSKNSKDVCKACWEKLFGC